MENKYLKAWQKVCDYVYSNKNLTAEEFDDMNNKSGALIQELVTNCCCHTTEMNKEEIKIYGYNIIHSDGIWDGRESQEELFLSEQERNDSLYKDYCDYFDFQVENEYITDCVNGQYIDESGNPKLTKEEFFDELKNAEKYGMPLGVIQLSDFHIQFEIFSKCINKK